MHPRGRVPRRSEQHGSVPSRPRRCPRRPATMNDVTRILSAIEHGDP
jgi:hypothetical protein